MYNKFVINRYFVFFSQKNLIMHDGIHLAIQTICITLQKLGVHLKLWLVQFITWGLFEYKLFLKFRENTVVLQNTWFQKPRGYVILLILENHKTQTGPPFHEHFASPVSLYVLSKIGRDLQGKQMQRNALLMLRALLNQTLCASYEHFTRSVTCLHLLRVS